MDASTSIFEAHRDMLQGLAYRMLGTWADAEDVVQDVYLKWSQAASGAIDNPRAWLATVCSRKALDQLKSARLRRESYPGPWLPDPYRNKETKPPDIKSEIDESVSTALMLAMEQLSPAERAAFILHDVFTYGFDEIGEILQKSTDATRKLASRARIQIQKNKSRFPVKTTDHERLLNSFLEAATSGNITALKSLLKESVVLKSDGGGKAIAVPKPLLGSKTVASFFTRIFSRAEIRGTGNRAALTWYNGAPGILIYESEKLVAAINLRIADHKIAEIFAHRNPDKLKLLESNET